MVESLLLTKRELQVIAKRLGHEKLTQQDSNYLSKFVRPKLKEISSIDSDHLLRKLEYNQKIASVEMRIKKLILTALKDVVSITIFGSAIYNDYADFRDIDVLVTIKNKQWDKLGEKYKLIAELKNKTNKIGLNLDFEIYSAKELYESYHNSPSLIFQLKDCKTIYGILKYPSKISIDKLQLRIKLDYSIIEKAELASSGCKELYKAIKNLWLVKLLLRKTVDNLLLNKIIEDELGKNLMLRLKNNEGAVIDKKIAWLYLNKELNRTLKEVNDAEWEKLVL